MSRMRVRSTSANLRFLFSSQIFQGNWDSDTVVYNAITPPIKARFIRILPRSWEGHVSMRAEFYTCEYGNQSTILLPIHSTRLAHYAIRRLFRYRLLFITMPFYMEGAVVSWLVRSTPDRAVRV